MTVRALGDLELPRTTATDLAREVCLRFHTAALVNHCARSFLWAASYGIDNGLAFDAELLYVCAMLHDVGLVPAFDSHTIDFETAGGSVAWVFAAGAGWRQARRDRVAEVVVAHMRDGVGPDADTEGHLLGVATSLDISGSAAQAWSPEFRLAVVRAYPLLDLAPQFVACFEDQATRKPSSAAASSVRGGIAARIATNPLGSVAADGSAPPGWSA